MARCFVGTTHDDDVHVLDPHPFVSFGEISDRFRFFFN